MTLVDRPARGTRPANRRELILAAATELFASRGYEHVGMGDVAEAVAVGPSALYRHFAGKEQLLAEVVGDVADRFATLLETPSEPKQALAAVATFALDHRSHAVLTVREARHLPPEAQAVVSARTRRARDRFTSALCAARPTLPRAEADIVASAALAVLISPSFHRLELPRPEYDTLLAHLAQRVLTAELHPAEEAAAKSAGLPRTSTRAKLLEAAIRLFAERTYASVSIDDVAASVGMAASSVYNHFPSKLDMLVTALNNGNGYLQLTLDETLAQAHDPTEALRGFVASYSRFALAHPDLVDVLITEVRNLPEDEAAAAQRAQRDYGDEWGELLRQVHNELDTMSARVVVQAALMIINDLSRTNRVRSRPDAEAILATLVRHVLAV
ncbi:MAG: TetR/AcrR family transcriptional regulator [Mycolicibacterium sp.]|nr:TetR/AcrR family transcriptional regulator [Mycolicibacterium sp.]